MADILSELEGALMKRKVPSFRVGDTVRVHVRVKEGDKERVQAFQGVVIARHSGRNRSTFTVRKVSGGVGVERVFPLHSPAVSKIDVLKRSVVSRGKLYYLRGRRGKSARLKEKREAAEA
jgi:large subunit ribosomal protein L19